MKDAEEVGAGVVKEESATTAPEKKVAPEEKKTLMLAKGQTPPTVDGVVNMGMGKSIRLPSLEAQRKGFMPVMVGRKKSDEPVDATRELLNQFPGIYKPLTAKGD